MTGFRLVQYHFVLDKAVSELGEAPPLYIASSPAVAIQGFNLKD